MTLIKKILMPMVSFLILGTIQTGFAASGSNDVTQCSNDVTQMEAQIKQYHSISTAGCPRNANNWGIDKVSNLRAEGKSKCTAKCIYAGASGASGPTDNCRWTAGNWGDTLNCKD